MRRPAVFVDRDGVLNAMARDESRGEMGSPLSAEHLAVLRQAPGFVRELNARGYLVVVVTHQPALAAGRLSPIGLDRIHRKLRQDIAAGGGRLDGIFFCPHDPTAVATPGHPVRPEFVATCRCQNPAPGLILQAAQVHNVDLQRSFLVCRDLQNVKAGRSAAVETLLLTKAKIGEIEASPDLRPHHVVASLRDVIRIIDAAREALLQP